jgi:hypothetical protein
MAIEEFWFVPATYKRSEYLDAPSPLSGTPLDRFAPRTAVVACVLLERVLPAKTALQTPLSTRRYPRHFCWFQFQADQHPVPIR